MSQNELAMGWPVDNIMEPGSKLNGKINDIGQTPLIGENNIQDKLKDETHNSVKKHDEIEMPNGHNSDSGDVIPRTKNLGEPTQDSEGTDTENKQETEKEDKGSEDSTAKNGELETDKMANKTDAQNSQPVEPKNNDESLEEEPKKDDCSSESITAESSQSEPKELSDDQEVKAEVKEEESEKEHPEEEEKMDVDTEKTEAADKAEEEEVEDDNVCECKPSCHSRLLKISNQIELTKSHLEEFIKLKKTDYTTDLTNLVRVFADISAFAQKSMASIKHLGEPFYTEEPQKGRRRNVRFTAGAKETPEKRTKEKKIEMNTFEPLTEDTFKSLKGLAVFAKWPNSGWYYPGIIEGLMTSDWKDSTNVKVKFYDGLVREMKNINILPAYLIPVDCIVCDLEDETEMVVVSSKSIESNNVEFTLAVKRNSETQIDLGFNKLAIKAIHMKTIKQQLEPNTDVSAKKMHMVSLDNLVSGRRSRGRINKDDDESGNESGAPRKGTRKSGRKAELTDNDEEESNQEAESTATPSAPTRGTKRRSSPPSKRSTHSKRSKQ